MAFYGRFQPVCGPNSRGFSNPVHRSIRRSKWTFGRPVPIGRDGHKPIRTTFWGYVKGDDGHSTTRACLRLIAFVLSAQWDGLEKRFLYDGTRSCTKTTANFA